jgi:hypothetical protein
MIIVFIFIGDKNSFAHLPKTLVAELAICQKC